KKLIIYILPVFIFALAGCKKDYLETVPSNGVTEDAIFGKYSSVSAALEGIYKQQFASGIGGGTRHDNFGQKAYDLALDLMGNDMVVHTQGYGWFNSSYNLTEWVV